MKNIKGKRRGLILAFLLLVIGLAASPVVAETKGYVWNDATFLKAADRAMNRISETNWEDADPADVTIVLAGDTGPLLEEIVRGMDKMVDEMGGVNDGLHFVGWVGIGLGIALAADILARRFLRPNKTKTGG